MATVPTPRVWTTGEKITGAKLNDVSNAITFANNPPRAHIYSSVAVALANAATVRVLHPDTASDTDNMAQGPGRMTFQTLGRFRLIFGLSMPAATYTQLDVNIRLNSANSPSGGVSVRTFNCIGGGGQIILPFDRDMTVGDYFEVYVTQTSGASRNTGTTTLGTFIQATWFSS